METISIKVKDITWDHDQHGFVTGTLHFNKTNFFGKETDYIEFGRFGRFNRYKVGVGSKITFASKVSDFGVQIGVGKVEDKSLPVTPTKCLVCGSVIDNHVYKKTSDLCCTNFLCQNKSTTPLMRIVDIIQPCGLSIYAVYRYFEKFPANGYHSNIDSILTLEAVWNSVGPKGTVLRQELLKKEYGNKWTDYNEFEVSLDKKLKNGFLFQEFWYICTIPEFDTLEKCSLIKFLNPYTFTSSDVDDLITKYSLTQKQADSIIKSTRHWELYSKRIKVVPPQQ